MCTSASCGPSPTCTSLRTTPSCFRCRGGVSVFSRRNPDVLKSLNIDESVRTELAGLIASRMAPQAKKVRADIEVTCFSIHGVDGIRAAMVGSGLPYKR